MGCGARADLIDDINSCEGLSFKLGTSHFAIQQSKGARDLHCVTRLILCSDGI